MGSVEVMDGVYRLSAHSSRVNRITNAEYFWMEREADGTGSHGLMSQIQARIPQIERSATSAVSSATLCTLSHDQADTVLDRIGSISYTRWRNEAFHPIDLWDASVD